MYQLTPLAEHMDDEFQIFFKQFFNLYGFYFYFTTLEKLLYLGKCVSIEVLYLKKNIEP